MIKIQKGQFFTIISILLKKRAPLGFWLKVLLPWRRYEMVDDIADARRKSWERKLEIGRLLGEQTELEKRVARLEMILALKDAGDPRWKEESEKYDRELGCYEPSQE